MKTTYKRLLRRVKTSYAEGKYQVKLVCSVSIIIIDYDIFHPIHGS